MTGAGAAAGADAAMGEAPARLDARMVFASDLSSLYVAVPKTGCTSIKTVLAAATGLIDAERGRARPQAHEAWRTRARNWSSLDPVERDVLLAAPHVLRFTSVRNPFERVVSCYLSKVVRQGASGWGRRMRELGVDSMLSFLEVVARQPPLRRDVHCRAMTDLCRPDRVAYDRVVRYERFEADLGEVLERLGLNGQAIPKPPWRSRTDAGSHVAALLGARECDLVREIYQRDFEAFGYPLERPAS